MITSRQCGFLQATGYDGNAWWDRAQAWLLLVTWGSNRLQHTLDMHSVVQRVHSCTSSGINACTEFGQGSPGTLSHGIIFGLLQAGSGALQVCLVTGQVLHLPAPLQTHIRGGWLVQQEQPTFVVDL